MTAALGSAVPGASPNRDAWETALGTAHAYLSQHRAKLNPRGPSANAHRDGLEMHAAVILVAHLVGVVQTEFALTLLASAILASKENCVKREVAPLNVMAMGYVIPRQASVHAILDFSAATAEKLSGV